MKFHAIITIVDDNNKEITRFHKEEDEQFKEPLNNTIFHKFNLGHYSIAESQEMRDFLDTINEDRRPRTICDNCPLIDICTASKEEREATLFCMEKVIAERKEANYDKS